LPQRVGGNGRDGSIALADHCITRAALPDEATLPCRVVQR
jgi:hypothetical protein